MQKCFDPNRSFRLGKGKDKSRCSFLSFVAFFAPEKMFGLTHSFTYTRTGTINNLLLCCEPDFMCSSVVPHNVKETIIKYANDTRVCLWLFIILFLKTHKREHYALSKDLNNIVKNINRQ